MSRPHPGVAGRGLSTSASFLIVAVGLFLAMGTLYTVTANTGERLSEARDDQRQRHHAVQETAVTVTNATWNESRERLTVTVDNVGDTTLDVEAVDTVVDGTYVGVGDYEGVTVDGLDSSHWGPGETLVLTDDDTVATFASTPARVTVVTESGVAVASEVTAT